MLTAGVKDSGVVLVTVVVAAARGGHCQWCTTITYLASCRSKLFVITASTVTPTVKIGSPDRKRARTEARD